LGNRWKFKYSKNWLGSAGIQTAALGFGGTLVQLIQHATEEYNGSTWSTSTPSLNTARKFPAGAGTQTAALAFGGECTT
jgi:hypothetical protein